MEFAESGCTIFRATSPLSDLETITTAFRTITSANQLSLYGAVAEICEEYESYRAGRPVEQSSSSVVPHVINTNVLLNNDDPAHTELLLQKYGERIEKLCVRVQSYIVILVENLVRIETLWFLQTNLDQSCHRRDNVTTLGARHRHTQLRDERIMTVQEEPSLHMNSTRKMSRMKCGHPGNFLR